MATQQSKPGFWDNLIQGANSVVTTIKNDLNAIADYGSTLPDDTSLSQSKYDFTYRVFPSDIGAEGSFNGHYMVININARDASSFADFVTGPGGSTRFGGQITQRINTFKVLPEELSKTDALRFKIDPQYKTASGQALSTPFPLPRFSRRIVESIALYMPSTMAHTTNAEYENISLTGLGHAMLSSGARAARDFGHGFGNGIGGGGTLGTLLNLAGGAASTLLGGANRLAQLGQIPFNPRVEVLYANTPQRAFQFEFLVAPSNQKESDTVEQIYRTLKFHQAPEINSSFPKALFWTAPSDFDITFYNRGKENTHIPRINTCVLETIDMDYAPTGVWSTFSNGHPVTMRMSLRFRELEVLSKLRVLQGF
jgi:hypothetical protein